MSTTQPPPKPVRKPPALPLGAPRISQDLVRPIPGVPVGKRAPDPATVAAARAAARQSSPDLVEHRLTEVERDLSAAVSAVNELKIGQDRVIRAVEGLTDKVDGWELNNSTAAVTKLQEEGKTKRLTMVIGLLTVLVNLAATVGVNVAMKEPAPAPAHQRRQLSANDVAIEACKKIHNEDLQGKCIVDIAIANISPQRR